MARTLKVYPNRPKCILDGCDRDAHMADHKPNGKYIWRKYCSFHHNERRKNFQNILKQGFIHPVCAHEYCNTEVTLLGTGENRELKFTEFCPEHAEIGAARKAGFETVAEYKRSLLKQQALDAGFTSVTAFLNSKHPYKKYRKDYCENIDGRLDFKCTYTPPPAELIEKHMPDGYYEAWLDVDHIDGNPENNDPENLQTLCKCCHNWKTLKEKDYATAGRKTLKTLRSSETPINEGTLEVFFEKKAA